MCGHRDAGCTMRDLQVVCHMAPWRIERGGPPIPIFFAFHVLNYLIPSSTTQHYITSRRPIGLLIFGSY